MSKTSASSSGISVIKIGGSTLGNHDTSLDDIAELHGEGRRIVVVHGGGATISEWLDRHGVESRFVRGLRVTDEAALDVVVAVLAGVVNKRLVVELESRGSSAIGLSGADGGILRAQRYDAELGFVGEVAHVDPKPILKIVDAGSICVMAPIAVEGDRDSVAAQLLNVNADTAAGEVAAALSAEHLVFLSDVAGVLDESGQVRPELTAAEASELLGGESITGGMIPKLQAAVGAASSGVSTFVADGREAGALRKLIGESEHAVATRIS
ncbi:MAG: acetylglutamate kinase [Chloroflexi bacterium]|nr:acetylglutamate kinase [Chloroflexota bacterium]